MPTEVSGLNDSVRITAQRDDVSAPVIFQNATVTAGVCASLLFVAIGVGYELQTYADGSLFSYAVAVQDAWKIHYHNLAGRLSVYLLAFWPAEAYVQVTGDAPGGVILYGFLFFVAQLLGLIATAATDRSRGRLIFTYACLSTACLCPLVFGFPTEVWMMHALFWPTLAVCHFARRGMAGAAATFALVLALVFTHPGALISAAAIWATLALRGFRDFGFRRFCRILPVVLLIWAFATTTLRPDDYIAGILMRAAWNVFNIGILTGPLIVLLLSALVGYAVAFALLQRLSPIDAHICAAALVAAALAAYWLGFDHAIHTDYRYYLRTVLLIATPGFGMLAAAHVLCAENGLPPSIARLADLMIPLTSGRMARMGIGALLLVMLVHSVETGKFVSAWVDYRSAVRRLAMGPASDPEPGNRDVVSSARIGSQLNELAWFSTTPYLSILVAPRFRPQRLVVDPTSNYFWLSCETATENLEASRAVPAASRELVRKYSCLHRLPRVSAPRVRGPG